MKIKNKKTYIYIEFIKKEKNINKINFNFLKKIKRKLYMNFSYPVKMDFIMFLMIRRQI